MAKFSEIATDRKLMTPGAQAALNDLDDFLADILEVQSESIPMGMRNRREDTTSFKMLIKKTTPKVVYVDPNSVAVQFQTVGGVRSITSATDERLARIERYRSQAEDKDREAFEYKDVNDMGEYEALVEMACMLAKNGILTEDDFSDEE